MDVSETVEVDIGLGSRAERVRCFGLEFVRNILHVQKFDQSRHLAKTKLHPEYPHRKKMNPALKQEISNMQLLDKIHTVFIAALS